MKPGSVESVTEEDADIEVCVATRKKIEVPEINCRLFSETPCVSLVPIAVFDRPKGFPSVTMDLKHLAIITRL